MKCRFGNSYQVLIDLIDFGCCQYYHIRASHSSIPYIITYIGFERVKKQTNISLIRIDKNYIKYFTYNDII